MLLLVDVIYFPYREIYVIIVTVLLSDVFNIKSTPLKYQVSLAIEKSVCVSVCLSVE